MQTLMAINLTARLIPEARQTGKSEQQDIQRHLRSPTFIIQNTSTRPVNRAKAHAEYSVAPQISPVPLMLSELIPHLN